MSTSEIDDCMIQIIKESNNETRELLKKFPFHVYVGDLCNDLEYTDLMEFDSRIIDWLTSNLEKENYMIYPHGMGEYSYTSNSILFKNSSDQLLFKLFL